MTTDDAPGDASDGGPFLDRAAAWAADLRYRDVPEPTLRAARAQLLSTLGAAVWTLDHPLGERITRAVRSEFGRRDGAGVEDGTTMAAASAGESDAPTTAAGDGTATFLPEGAASPRAACYGHAALSMALDFDDTVLGGHTGHSAALVPLAYGEARGASGKDVLVAVVAANEVSARLAAAAAIGPFRGQQTAYVHALAAAVARGVVEGDDPETLADAAAVALGQPPWPLVPDFLGSDAKVLSAAEPVLGGLSAVAATREGLTGNRDVVEAEGGFLDEFADRPLPEFLGGLGDRWHTRAVTVKPYPGCAYVTAPVHAALRLRERMNVRESDGESVARVASIDVYGSLFTRQVDDLAGEYVDGPDSPVAALNFSVPYNVAVALRDGRHGVAQLRPDRTGDEVVWDLADRVAVHHDAAITMAALRSEVPLGAMLRRAGPGVVPYAVKTVGPATALRNLPTLLRFVRKRPLPDDLSGADKAMGARVEVTLSDGRRLSETCEHPPGFAGRGLDETRAIARRKLREALEARVADPEVAPIGEVVDDIAALQDRAAVDLAPLGRLARGGP